MPLPKKNYLYTYADYLAWPDEERWEIIGGVPYNMSPAPNRMHQEISIEIARQLSNFLLNKPCKVYSAPFDVRFSPKNVSESKIITVVQPDITVVCDKSKLDEKGCIGSPDFIIEIVSPSDASRDYKEKFALYEKQKVKEYWIIDPATKIVQSFTLNKKNEYGRPQIYSLEDKAPVAIFPDFKIDLSLVFSE